MSSLLRQGHVTNLRPLPLLQTVSSPSCSRNLDATGSRAILAAEMSRRNVEMPKGPVGAYHDIALGRLAILQLNDPSFGIDRDDRIVQMNLHSLLKGHLSQPLVQIDAMDGLSFVFEELLEFAKVDYFGDVAAGRVLAQQPFVHAAVVLGHEADLVQQAVHVGRYGERSADFVVEAALLVHVDAVPLLAEA
jgi:hypothetical protein